MLTPVSGDSNAASVALDDLIGIGGFDTWSVDLAAAPLPANVTDVIILGQDGRPTLPLTPTAADVTATPSSSSTHNVARKSDAFDEPTTRLQPKPHARCPGPAEKLETLTAVYMRGLRSRLRRLGSAVAGGRIVRSIGASACFTGGSMELACRGSISRSRSRTRGLGGVYLSRWI